MRTTLALFALLLLAALPVTADTVSAAASSPAAAEAEALPEAPEIEAEIAQDNVDLEDFLATLADDEPQRTVPPFCDTVQGTSCSSPGSTQLCSVTYTTRATCTCSSGYQWMCPPC